MAIYGQLSPGAVVTWAVVSIKRFAITVIFDVTDDAIIFC